MMAVIRLQSLPNTYFSLPVDGLMMVSWVERSEMPSSTDATVSALSTELATEGASCLACAEKLIDYVV